MEINKLIVVLKRRGHMFDLDRNGKVVSWIEAGHTMMVVDGKPMSHRRAQGLLPWAERFSN